MWKVVECKDVAMKTHHFHLRVKHNPMGSDAYVRPSSWFVSPCIHSEANMPTSGLDGVSYIAVVTNPQLAGFKPEGPA